MSNPVQSLSRQPDAQAPEQLSPADSSSSTSPPGVTALSRYASAAERYGLLVILAGLIALFSLLSPDVFPTAANWQSIMSSQSVVFVIALGLLVPLVAGNFDLSVGSVAIMSSIAIAGAQQNDHAPLWVACAVGVSAGLGAGVVNGLLITRIHLNALIATLGTSVVMGGLIQLYTGGTSITNGISPSLTRFGSENVDGIPKIAVVAAVSALIITYVLVKTPFGRQLMAIGSNAAAARLVGIRVERVVFSSFVISGCLGGCAGVLLLAQQGSGNPTTDGIGVLLPALAAVNLGASTLTPGQFNVPGTAVGLVLVAVLVSGLTLLGAASWVQSVATGGALIVAVGVSEAFRRQRNGAK